MKFKKTLLAFCLIMCIFFCVSSVAAGDVNDTIVGSDDNQIELSQDSIDDKVIEDDNLKSSEIDEILTSNPKTFSDLNTTINGNDDSDVYLDSNYTFELGSDSDFKDGVVIGRAVTVHGNGFTISGDNAARIFSVTNSNVVFRDIVFVNGKSSGGGGAINGQCMAINCTFNSNFGESGGAMAYGSARDCTFNSNSAGLYGGAIVQCQAENCIFNFNDASAGGAMAYGSAIHCTFNSNRGYDGGAIYEGSAINCTFNSNFGYYGGVMHDSSAINCTFKNNEAYYSGGAMFGDGYVADNCQFINNTAVTGGATYQ
ncbi:hypothetical protein, partial [Methanobrevibacter sp.]|uniref:hypothetical protein n=1 Tax=Methanobrevibacter sp. TaxID=66852 RepID=UPI0025DB661B